MFYPQFPYLAQHRWLLFNDLAQPTPLSPDESLAFQDSLIRWLPEMSVESPTAILHYYPIERPTVLLGAKDTRLPQLQAGLTYLRERGYQYALRPHGGLGVVCDPGVLNIGLASNLDYFPLSIDSAYEQMVQLIGLSLAPYGVTVEAYEIPQSYCPGTYDLVVNGQKIGGIAQRRFKNGITTAAYLSVNGDQAQRANLMADFYRLSQADSSYPLVSKEVMTTIETVIQQPLNLATYQQQLTDLFRHYSIVQTGDYAQTTLQTIYPKMLSVAQQRTDSLHSTLH